MNADLSTEERKRKIKNADLFAFGKTIGHYRIGTKKK